MRVPAGGAPCLGVGRPESGALPPPTARPSGGLPGCWAAVRVRALLGRVGRVGLSGAFWCASPFIWPFLLRSLLVRPPPGWGCLVCGCFWVFFLFCCLSSSPPRCAPVVSCFACFPAPGALGLGVLPPPPPLFLFFCFPPPRSLLSPPFLAFRLPLASCSPPPFFFSLSCCLFFLLRVCCVCSGVSCCVFPVLPVRCAVRVVCAVSGGWCCWFPVSLPFVGGLLVALAARRCRWVVCVGSGARVWSGRRWASSLWRLVPLCCVLWRCAAVWCCAVVPCLLSFCFSPSWWRWLPVFPRWFWAPGRFRAVSVSVLCLCGAVLVCLRRCSLFGALLPSRGWLVFCVVACCVCVFAVGPGCPLLSPGGSWWLLVSCPVVFSPCLGNRSGGAVLPRDGYTTCLCSFSPRAAQKSKFSKLVFLMLCPPKMTIQGTYSMFSAPFTCFSPCLGNRSGGGSSQGVGTEPANEAFHHGQLKNCSFRKLLF